MASEDVDVLPFLTKVIRCLVCSCCALEEEMDRYGPTKNYLSKLTARDYSALENNILELNLKDWLLDIQVNFSV